MGLLGFVISFTSDLENLALSGCQSAVKKNLLRDILLITLLGDLQGSNLIHMSKY